MEFEVRDFINVLGEKVEVFTPHPTNNTQDVDLRPKCLTKDCLRCWAKIPRKGALEIVDWGKENASDTWKSPGKTTIRGVCIGGEYPKILIGPRGIKGTGRCLIKNKTR